MRDFRIGLAGALCALVASFASKAQTAGTPRDLTIGYWFGIALGGAALFVVVAAIVRRFRRQP